MPQTTPPTRHRQARTEDAVFLPGRYAADAVERLGELLGPYVDGGFAQGEGPILVSVDPSTGAPLASVKASGPEMVDRAVETAVLASALWRSTPFEERALKLRVLADRLLGQAEELAGLIAHEQGKPWLEALTLEILPALDHLRFLARQGGYLRTGELVDCREPLYAHKQVHDLYDPLGVVAIVTPFPLPLGLPLVQIATALIMGNAVVLKPSERTSLCALRIGELCAEAGFPPGLVNVVPGRIEEALHLVAHPRVDKVFFTGSTEAGRQIMATAGCAPRPVVLGLGGKHPSIVAGDADLELAARGVVWGACANAGQNCGAIERVYVEEVVAQRFVDLVVREVDKLKVGHPLSEETDVGPLICEPRRREVHRQVTEAVEAGAKLLRGGTVPRGSGYFYPPTVLLGPPPDSRLMREETLGPVIPIVVVESLERAILMANESEFALTASGWTRSAEIAERLGVALQAGVVTVNDVLYAYGEPGLTWSGHRKSGIGHFHGLAGLREMSRKKSVSYDYTQREAPVFAFPYDATASRIVLAALRSLHAGGFFRRLKGIVRLMRLKRFRSRVPLRSFLLSYKQRPR